MIFNVMHVKSGIARFDMICVVRVSWVVCLSLCSVGV